jgi:hypothetical protein
MIQVKKGNLDDALGLVELQVRPYIGTNAYLATAAAAVYSLLAQHGQAITLLEKAIDLGYSDYIWLINDTNFEQLWTDARAKELLQRVKANWEANRKAYHL